MPSEANPLPQGTRVKDGGCIKLQDHPFSPAFTVKCKLQCRAVTSPFCDIFSILYVMNLLSGCACESSHAGPSIPKIPLSKRYLCFMFWFWCFVDYAQTFSFQSDPDASWSPDRFDASA